MIIAFKIILLLILIGSFIGVVGEEDKEEQDSFMHFKYDVTYH